MHPDKKDWIWSARFASWSSNLDLTPEEADRHARYLKENGVNAVMVSHHEFMSRREKRALKCPGHWLFYQGSINEPIVENTLRIITEACQRLGMKVIEHHSSNFVPPEGAYQGSSFADWSNVDARTGERMIRVPDMYPNLACINNPDWRQKYFAYLRHLAAKIPLDGLMHDDIHFHPAPYFGYMTCGCAHCRAKFRREAGFDLPTDPASPFWREQRGEVWDAFLRFRIRSISDELRKAHRVLGTDKILFTCNSNDHSAKYVRGAGICQDGVADAVDILLYEEMTRSVFWDNRQMAVARKIFSGRAYAYRMPALICGYGYSYSEEFFCWALTKAFGLQNFAGYICDTLDIEHHSMNIYPRSYESLRVNQCYTWEAAHADVFRRPRPAADLAVVFSPGTVENYLPDEPAYAADRPLLTGSERWCDGYYVNDCAGWCDTWLGRHVAFEVATDKDLEQGRMDAYRGLVLPNVACMDEAAAGHLRAFVENGGRLLATHHTSLYDREGRRRENFLLADLFGVDFYETVFDLQTETFAHEALAHKDLSGYDQLLFAAYQTKLAPESYARLQTFIATGGDLVEFYKTWFNEDVVIGRRTSRTPLRAVAAMPVTEGVEGLEYRHDWSQVKVRAGTRVLCTARHGDKNFPWLVQRSHGRGEVLYCAGKIGIMSYTRGYVRANSPKGLPYPEDQIRYRLWVDTAEPRWREWMRRLAEWAVAGAPMIRVENAPPGVLINSFKTETGWAVNLINTGGAQAARGSELPASHAVVYPPIAPMAGDWIELVVRAPIGRAVVISPDFEGERPVGVKREGEFTRVRIPAAYIHRYSVVLMS